MPERVDPESGDPMYAPGGKGGPGRPPGRPTDATRLQREIWTGVYLRLQDEAGEGGDQDHMFEWAKDKPTEFYRLAPRMMNGPVDVGPDSRLARVLTWLKPK